MSTDSIKWLKSTIDLSHGKEDVAYALHDIPKEYEIVTLDPENLYVVLKRTEDHWLDFAVLEFYYQNEDGLFLEPIFYGAGTVNGLNECRHTYWGKDGYLFYPNKNRIILALNYLSNFFDFD